MSEHPKMLYRPAGTDHGLVHEVWGHKVHLLTVDGPDAEAAAVSDGWSLSPPPEGGCWPERSEFSLLDEPAKRIVGALPDLTADELKALLEAEQSGKARKGVVKLLEDALTAKG
jgi:hypothetical protein